MPKILVVEDAIDVRENIEDILSLNDYEVYSANDGCEALAMLEKLQPDVIISDVMMPKMDGIELRKVIQKDKYYSTIPFVFLTAKASYHSIREGMELGADDYIVKPFTAVQLLKSVDVRLNKRKENLEPISELVQNISKFIPHELRNPLMPIKGYLNLLIDNFKEISDEEILEYIHVVRDSTNRLHNKIERFIFASTLETLIMQNKVGSDICKGELLSTGKTIQRVCANVSAKYNRHNDVQQVLSDLSLSINEKCFNIILEEVIDNAFKFSKKGTVVSVYSVKLKKYLKIQIEDNGIGMKKEEISKVGMFMRFNYEGEYPGSGLGLYFVKKILSILGGSIKITSNELNATRVIIKLPL